MENYFYFIPLEIKLIIFEYVGIYGRPDISKLSLICHQIGDIVKYNPKLW